jgi:general secretion pathway protein D
VRRTALLRGIRIVAVGISALLVLCSCATSTNATTTKPAADSSPAVAEAGESARQPAVASPPAGIDAAARTEPGGVKNERVKAGSDAAAVAALTQSVIIKGTDEVLAPAKPVVVPRSVAKDVTFKFEQAPVKDVVQAVLGDLMGFSYVIHQQLSGTVTVSTAAPVPADQALSLLEAVLQGNNVLMVMDANGVFHVGTAEALRGVIAVPKRVDQPSLPPGSGMVIVPLKFIGVAEMAEILRPLTRPEAFVRIDTLRNMLILAGSRNQIDGWLEIVRTFDVDLLKGMSVAVFPLQYVSIKDIEDVMRAIASSTSATSSGSGAAAPAPVIPATPAASGAAPGSAAAGSALGSTASSNLVSASASAALSRMPFLGSMRIIPLERLNSLLVISPKAAYLEELKVWIERLDRPSNNDGTPRLFVYPVQNGTAGYLAGVLGSLFGAGAGGSGGTSGVAPGLRSTTGSTTPSSSPLSFGGASGSSMSLGGAGGGTGGGTGGGFSASQQGGSRVGGGGVSAASLAPNVKIVADDLNNSIIVFAPPADYAKIEAALRQLDVPATQVLIEATIAEVSLSGDLQYGLQWYFTDTARHDLTGTGQLNLASSGAIGPVQPGFSYTWSNSAGAVRAVLNALASRSLIRVISSPTVMVQDNYSASINVGDQVPIQSASYTAAVGGVTNSYQYKDTGVLLNVTPTVNASDLISMTINQSVTDVGAIDAATGQLAFLQRQVASRVVVKSGDAIVLGGLIRENTTNGSQGLPLLSQIPIIGALFGAQTQSGNRTELIFIITPRVVRSSADSRLVGNEMRDRMRGIVNLLDERRWLLPPALKDAVPEKTEERLPADAVKP